MSSSSENFVVERGKSASEGSSEGFVVDARNEPEPRPRRMSKPLASSGSFWAIAATTMLSDLEFVGLVQMEWDLLTAEAAGLATGAMQTVLQYRAVNYWDFASGAVSVPQEFDFTSTFSAIHAQNLCAASVLKRMQDGDQVQETSMVDTLAGNIVTAVVHCSESEAETLCTLGVDSRLVFRSIPFGRRSSCKGQGCIPAHPKVSVIQRFRKMHRQQQASAPSTAERSGTASSADPLFYLPARVDNEELDAARRNHAALHPEVDPIRSIGALAFARHLRSVSAFQDALDDGNLYHSIDDPESLVPVDHSVDPSTAHIKKSACRADVVAMNLMRRRFAKWRANDSVKSINIYSDASPVTGSELQGMLIDIVFWNGDVRREVLPGSTLADGHQDTHSKGVALLWACWLIAGPDAEALQWFCSKVRSFTTDFGVEMHILEMPEITNAFVEWAGGKALLDVRHLVQPRLRQFGRALRVAGWSHAQGNIMKAVAFAAPDWPEIVEQLRALCKFFRNRSHRLHLARRLDGVVGDIQKRLRFFTASFAKWRYETVDDVLKQLLALRDICEDHFDGPLFFGTAQDQEEISAVHRACKNKRLWRWMAGASKYLFSPIEKVRRWGMVCDCPEHVALRKAGKRKTFRCLRIGFECMTIKYTNLYLDVCFFLCLSIRLFHKSSLLLQEFSSIQTCFQACQRLGLGDTGVG